MRTILAIVRKEFIQIRRDRRMFIMSFLSPVIQLVVLGYAANTDVNNLPLLICDQDHSSFSREFVERFGSSGAFRIVGYAESPNQIDRSIENGRALIALVIPPGFEDNLKARRTVQVQAIADGSETNSASVGLSYAALIVGRYSQDILFAAFSRLGAGRLKPAVLAIVLLMTTMSFTSLAVVREKETGTMEQLDVTPIRPYQFIIGKLAPFMVLGLADVALVMLVATLWFRVPLKGSIPLLFGLCVVFELATLGLGLLISTISKTEQESAMITSFFISQPIMILSGFAFPIANMPGVIRFLTLAMPTRYFMFIVRGIFLKGIGFGSLWPDALGLLILGIVILTISIRRFHKKLG
jgi:ABC-2 type transport system permease protein